MHVFIGLAEECNMISTYAKAFRSLGHETYTVVFKKEVFNPTSQYDEVLIERIGSVRKGARLWERAVHTARACVIWLSVFVKAIGKCDTFIFIFATSFLPGFWDYPILKMCGKRIVSVFLGSDIRYWYAYDQEMRMYGWERELEPYVEYRKSVPTDVFAKKFRVVRAAERFADLILSNPEMGQLQTRPYMCLTFPLDLSRYRFNVPDREVPIIVHAPTDSRAKGTQYVLSTINQLRKEGIRLEFRLIQGMPNDQLRELLADADIVIDHLFGHVLGALAVESLATGNVVLGRYNASYAHIPLDCPVVNVNKDTLASQLRRVILDRELRRHLAHAGREYVEKYHDYLHAVQQIVNWLKSGDIETYDVVPRFFQNSFFMPPELLKEEEIRRRHYGGAGLCDSIKKCFESLFPL